MSARRSWMGLLSGGRTVSATQPPTSRPEPGPGRPVRSGPPERAPLPGPGPRAAAAAPEPEGPALGVVLVSRDNMLAGALRSLIEGPGGVRVLDWHSQELDSAIRHADVVIVDMPPTFHERTFAVIDGRFLGRTVVLLQEGEHAEALPPGPPRVVLFRPLQIGELWAAITGTLPPPPGDQRDTADPETPDAPDPETPEPPDREQPEVPEPVAAGTQQAEPAPVPAAADRPEGPPDAEAAADAPETVGEAAGAAAARAVEGSDQGLPVAGSGRLIGLSGRELEPVVRPGQVAPGMDEATFERLRRWGTRSRQSPANQSTPRRQRRARQARAARAEAKRGRSSRNEARRAASRQAKAARAEARQAARAEAAQVKAAKAEAQRVARAEAKAARAEARTVAREESRQASAARAEARTVAREKSRQARLTQAQARRDAREEAGRANAVRAEARRAASRQAKTARAEARQAARAEAAQTKAARAETRKTARAEAAQTKAARAETRKLARAEARQARAARAEARRVERAEAKAARAVRREEARQVRSTKAEARRAARAEARTAKAARTETQGAEAAQAKAERAEARQASRAEAAKAKAERVEAQKTARAEGARARAARTEARQAARAESRQLRAAQAEARRAARAEAKSARSARVETRRERSRQAKAARTEARQAARAEAGQARAARAQTRKLARAEGAQAKAARAETRKLARAETAQARAARAETRKLARAEARATRAEARKLARAEGARAKAARVEAGKAARAEGARAKAARVEAGKAARAEGARARAAQAEERKVAREETRQANAARAEVRRVERAEANSVRAARREEARRARTARVGDARRVAGARVAAGRVAAGRGVRVAVGGAARPAVVVVLMAVVGLAAAGWRADGGPDTLAGEVAAVRAVGGTGGGLVVQDPRVGPIEPLHALVVGAWLGGDEGDSSLEAAVRAARGPGRYLLAGVVALAVLLLLLLMRVGPGTGAAAGPGPAPPHGRPRPAWRLGVAALAGALVALDPLLVRGGRSANGTVLALLLALGALALAWALPARPTLRWLPAVGAAGGLALLISPLALPALAVPAVAALLQRRTGEVWRALGALAVGVGLWLVLPIWVAGQDLGAGQAGWLLGRPPGRGSLTASLAASPLSWLLVAAGLVAAILTWRHRSGARPDAGGQASAPGPGAARLLAWAATTTLGALVALGLGYPAEQALAFAVPAAAVALAFAAGWAAAAVRGPSTGRRMVLAGVGVALAGLLVAQGVDWGSRYGKGTDDGLGRLVASVAAQVPDCAAVNASGPDDRSRLLAAGLTVTEFPAVAAAQAAGVRYFVLTGDATGRGGGPIPALAAWVRQHGNRLARHPSPSFSGVELWRVAASPLDPVADNLPVPGGVFSTVAGSACGGYRVVDSQAGQFHTAYEALGGKAVLGRPLGSVWTSDGPALQAFDTMVLGAAPAAGGQPGVRPIELPPLLAKLNAEAVADADIPLPSARAPVTDRQARALLGDPAIARAYLGTDPATASADDWRRARERFGRPLGLPQMMPDGAVRQPFELVVLELPADGGPARPAALGRLAVGLGLVPKQATKLEVPPGPSARLAETRLDTDPLVRPLAVLTALLVLAAGAGILAARRERVANGGEAGPGR